jgi:hypothetical protein
MNYKEMSSLRADPPALRGFAAYVLGMDRGNLAERDINYLHQVRCYDGTKDLGTRQLEYLYALREKVTRSSHAGGYVAHSLVLKAWERRMELPSFDDEEWLDERRKKGEKLVLSATEWRNLFRICRTPEIDLLPDDWINLK